MRSALYKKESENWRREFWFLKERRLKKREKQQEEKDWMNSGGKTASGCWCNSANILSRPSFGIPGYPATSKTPAIYKALSCLSASGQTDAVIIRLTNAIWRKERWGVRDRDACLCARRVLATVFQCRVLLFTLLQCSEMGVGWWGWGREGLALSSKPVSFQPRPNACENAKLTPKLSLFPLTKANFSKKVRGKF